MAELASRASVLRSVQAVLLAGTLALFIPGAGAQAPDGDETQTLGETNLALPLSYDMFDIRRNAGRPLWLGLPPVPFLERGADAEQPRTFALDPNPIGPPQTLQQPEAEQPRALALDPHPTGPPQTLQKAEAVQPRDLALDPHPMGPPQTLRPVQHARSPFDPAPMGPLARLQAERPAVAMHSLEDSDSAETGVSPPEETGSVVILRRRY